MFRRVVSFDNEATPEIEMRLFDPADAEACFAVVARNRAYLRQWLPWVDRTHSPLDIRTFIETIAIPQFDANNGPNCGVWMDGNFAGGIGCHAINWANRNCSIGYWVDAAHQRKGVITKCCTAMLDYLFGELGLHRVVIECGTENTRSCAIPQRLGFRREGLKREAEWVGGRWVDLVIWSMLDREWRERAQ
jgi:ribosomal-protein-serine acetyltransferase